MATVTFRDVNLRVSRLGPVSPLPDLARTAPAAAEG